MNTAVIALLSALSVAGVGTTAVAMSGGQMMSDHPMMGDQGNGGGMHDGNNGTYGGGGNHGQCHCCDGDEGNDAGQDQLGLSP
jgi:hypothetical protein